MCHESAKQMEQLLQGAKSTLQTKGLVMLAENQDKNFNSVDKRFANVEVKLDKIIELIGANKKATDERIEQLKKEWSSNCADRNKLLKADIELLKLATEDISYFKRNPKFLQGVAILILIIIAFVVGKTDVIEKFL
jgi:hypothetical protein